MKKIKLLFSMTLIILTCTGCTVEYNLNVTEENIEEVIKVNDYITSTRTKEDILNEYNTWYPTYVNFITQGESIEIEDYSQKTDGVEYHNKKINTITNGYNYTYDYTYPINKYYDAYTLARAYSETTVQQAYTNLIIKTSNKNYLCDYDYFEEVKVNITVDPEIYKLNYTNTSNINNNTYTWILNRSNCNDSQIILTLDINNQYDRENDADDNNSNIKSDSEYTLYIFLGAMLLIVVIGYFIFKRMKEKNENIDLDD